MQSENENLNIVRQLVEKGFGEADMDVVDNVVHTHVIEHQHGRPNGIEALKKSIKSLADSFSSRKYVLEHFSTYGDTVWVNYLFTGLHTGMVFGIPGSGKEVRMQVMDIVKIRDGRVVEHWGVPDRFALLVQIGAITPPSAPPPAASGS